MTSNSPIGIFDSGIGGLTIAQAITRTLPYESLIYYGDTAHLPYGDKSSESICDYSKRISDFLLDKGCKLIVIACNTASAVAYNALKVHLGNDVEVVNVIEPVIDHLIADNKIGKVGIIGTLGTIQSKIYEKNIRVKNANIAVTSLATPLLAPMIEAGFFKNTISQEVIKTYLSDESMNDIQALILACTHYPLIKSEIEQFYNSKVPVVDSPKLVANFVMRLLEYHHLLNSEARPEHHFYVSDYTSSFEETTRLFYGEAIKLEHHSIW